MTEQLPISIKITTELVDRLKNIRSVANKLEAQLNFQTLTANWYGDEEDILTITLFLSNSEDFKTSKNGADIGSIEVLADDVFSRMINLSTVLNCHIAITPSELQLLEQQPKLLLAYLPVKLTKVMNLLAKHLCFPQI